MNDAVFDWLLVVSTRVTLVVAAAWLASSVARSWSVRSRALLWRATLVAVAVTCVVPTSTSELPSVPRIDPTPSGAVAVARDRPDSVPSAHRSAQVPAVAPPLEGGAGRALRTRKLVPWIWAVGAGLHVLWLIAGLLRLWVHVRRSEAITAGPWVSDARRLASGLGIDAAPPLALSPWLGAPALVGLARPTVQQPIDAESWATSCRRSVLAHELAHLAHRDPWFTRAALLLRSILWFHPAMVWAAREVARFHELRCDRAAVELGVEPVDYAESLVRVARSQHARGAPTLALTFTRRSILEERVRAVRGGGTQVRGRGAAGAIAVLVGTSAAASALMVQTRPAPATSSGLRVALADDVRGLAVSGSCAVRVVPGDRLELRALAAHPGAARRFHGALEVKPGAEPGTWSVIAPRRPTDGSLVLELTAPPSLALDVTVHEGSLHATAPLAELEATVSLGWIAYAPGVAPVGPVRLHVGRGGLTADLPRTSEEFSATGGLADVDVVVREAGSTGPLRVTTGRGAARLTMPDMERIRLHVSNPTGSVGEAEGASAAHGPEAWVASGYGVAIATDSAP